MTNHIKDSYYFSHDSNARNDQKMLSLRLKHGMLGYGIFFGIIEIMREANCYRLPFNLQILSFDLREEESLISDIIKNFGLFKFSEDGKYFYSESLTNRMNRMEEIRLKRTISGRLGGLHKTQKITKGIIRIEQKIDNHKNDEKPRSLEEVKTYFDEIKSSEANNFFDHFESNGWKVGGKSQMKNWKAAARRWVNTSARFANEKSIAPIKKISKPRQNCDACKGTGWLDQLKPAQKCWCWS